MLPIITEHLAEKKDAALPVADLCALFGFSKATLYRQQAETVTDDAEMKLRDAMQRIAWQWPIYGPHLITNVETTPGPIADGDATPHIHQALKNKCLLPTLHIVDTGYLDAELLVTSKREYEVEMLGPTRLDYKWQAQAGEGFDAGSFQIDWEGERAICPAGRESLSWTPAVDNRTNEVVKIKFSMRDCQPCANRAKCTRAKRRTITLRRRDEYYALQAARKRETTDEYATEYKKRAGIEGTISQGVRVCGLRRSRYIGEAKTHLQHVLTGTAINFVRIYDWLTAQPRAKTQVSTFSRLMGQSAAA